MQLKSITFHSWRQGEQIIAVLVPQTFHYLQLFISWTSATQSNDRLGFPQSSALDKVLLRLMDFCLHFKSIPIAMWPFRRCSFRQWPLFWNIKSMICSESSFDAVGVRLSSCIAHITRATRPERFEISQNVVQTCQPSFPSLLKSDVIVTLFFWKHIFHIWKCLSHFGASC